MGSRCVPPAPPARPCFDVGGMTTLTCSEVAPFSRRSDQYVYNTERCDLYIAQVGFDNNSPDIRTRIFDWQNELVVSNPLTNAFGGLMMEPAIKIPPHGRIAFEVSNRSASPVIPVYAIATFRRFFLEDDNVEAFNFSKYAPPATSGLDDGSSPPGYEVKPFYYIYEPNNGQGLAAGASVEREPFRLDAGWDFEWTGISGYIDGPSDTEVLLRWTDASGQYQQNTGIPAFLLLGQTMFPMPWCPGASILYFDVDNTSATPIAQMQLVLAGRKYRKV